MVNPRVKEAFFTAANLTSESRQGHSFHLLAGHSNKLMGNVLQDLINTVCGTKNFFLPTYSPVSIIYSLRVAKIICHYMFMGSHFFSPEERDAFHVSICLRHIQVPRLLLYIF